MCTYTQISVDFSQEIAGTVGTTTVLARGSLGGGGTVLRARIPTPDTPTVLYGRRGYDS